MAERSGFAQLYRAALAETDPEKKSRLLRELQLILLQWEQDVTRSVVAEPRSSDRTYTDSAA
jgi:hypothetical protein